MMGDTKKLPSGSISSHKSSASTRLTVLDAGQGKLSSGSSGATLSSAVNSAKPGIDDEDEHGGTPSRSTRRGRSSNLKGLDMLNQRISASDADGRNGSPGGPAAYLNSVRNNLNFDCSSAMNDKAGNGASNCSTNGNTVGYKPPQKRKSRLQETGNHHKPAEVFRKDLISAMKIPDTAHLSSEEYWVMRDTWRMEWEKGVQVPVNPDALPGVKLDVVPKDTKGDFRMPRKMIKTTPDVGDRDTVNVNILADRTCRYDLDEVDVSWLKVVNEERHWQGFELLDEFTMEIIMEELETQCHDNMQLAIKTKEGLGIEYDENIVCDVCKSPECEEGNEMVFCDGCNLCVHQACYGILKVPDGSWLCKPCALGIRGSAICCLCGKKGGAMKSTKSGRKWAHMSCALWIPEITIADPERMEPITKVSLIPTSRWSLVCSVCKQRSVGACIQCSVKHCVTAYHVTCAMESGFDMITDCCSPGSAPASGETAIIFRSYCQKHSKNYKKRFENSPGKKSEEERRSDRQKRIAELEEDFFTLVKSEGVANNLNIPLETTVQVMEYWKLKRKANFNRPLVTPKQEEGKALEEAAETGLQRRLRMFTHLRQDLERVRNLCYMIGKREKLKRVTVITMSNVFLEQFHHLESLMLQNKEFDPKTQMASLPKFGSEKLLQLAKEESKELMKTKEWSQFDSGDETSETMVPGDLDEGETIMLLKPRSNVNVMTNSPESKAENLNKTSGRKNGLFKDMQPKKLPAKQGKTQLKSSNHEKTPKSNSKKKRHGSSMLFESESDHVKQDIRRLSRDSDGTAEILENVATSKHKDGKRNQHKTEQKSTSTNHDRGSSEVEDAKVHDTVKDVQSNQKPSVHRGRLKRPGSKASGKDFKDDTSNDAETDSTRLQTKNHNANQSVVRKKRKSTSDGDCTSKQTKLSVKTQPERTRRSPRHAESSDTDDFDIPKSKMTISTETISETKRLDTKPQGSDTEKRKRNRSKSSGLPSPTEPVKSPRLDHSANKDQESKEKRKLAKSPSTGSSVAHNATVPRSTRSGSKSSEKENVQKRKGLRSRSSSEDISPSGSETGKKERAAKNGKRALALSSGQVGNISTDCDQREEGDATSEASSQISSVQGLEDPNRLESPVKLGHESPKSVSSPVSKSPVIVLEKPNPAFIAAGLNISYGSNAPPGLRQRTQSKSPPKTKSTGLKWVSLAEDHDNPRKCDSVGSKDQEGYRGDMDESDLESQIGPNKSSHKRLSSRRRSSLNPGKYRTGIGVFSPRSSDSSEDDFDISFTTPSASSQKINPRQKLRPISSNTENEQTQISQVSEKVSKSLEKSFDKNDEKMNEPKNVKAVGGILGALKSERDVDIQPFVTRTTDGKNSQDNFFEKFSLLSSKPMESSSPTFGNVGQGNGGMPFDSNQYVFQSGAMAFQSHSLFPFGPHINPWQLDSTMPSITPSNYPPVFYQYPMQQQQSQTQKRDIQPSPPPLPDSTLSPESFVPNSTSVAVQASPQKSVTSLDAGVYKHRQEQRNSESVWDVGNEWEIVREDGEAILSHHHHHHRKHKKKKKKKKKRKRMLFPEGYESEKRDFSSPGALLPGPTHGAIVPRGHSTQYGVNQDSPSADSSVITEGQSDVAREERPHKLVLKINKKDLIRLDEPHFEKTGGSSGDSSSAAVKESAGLKLTIKKAQYERLLKKEHHRKKVHASKIRHSANHTHNNDSTTALKPERKSSMLRRLGLDCEAAVLENNTSQGIGQRALRERKPPEKKDGKGNSNIKNEEKSEKVRHKSKLNSIQNATEPRKRERRVESTNPNDEKLKADIAAGKILRPRGRPKKRQPDALKKEPSDFKESEQSSRDERKDMAKFAGWSTKSSKYGSYNKPGHTLPRASSIGSMSSLQFKPSSAGGFRGKGSTVPIRSFSTDSDQSSTLAGGTSHDSQPARHWKKRKVHEHETQASEKPYEGKMGKVTNQSAVVPSNTTNTFSAGSQDCVNTTKKSILGRSSEFVSSGKAEKDHKNPNKGQKLNQIISSLGEKASTKASMAGLPSDSDKKIKTVAMKLGTVPPKSPPARIMTSPSTDKNIFSQFSTSPHTVSGCDSKTVEGNSSTNQPKQRMKSESSNSTATKSYIDCSVDFALQTGPLNYKIPKKLHQTLPKPNLTGTGHS